MSVGAADECDGFEEESEADCDGDFDGDCDGDAGSPLPAVARQAFRSCKTWVIWLVSLTVGYCLMQDSEALIALDSMSLELAAVSPSTPGAEESCCGSVDVKGVNGVSVLLEEPSCEGSVGTPPANAAVVARKRTAKTVDLFFIGTA